MGKDNFYKNSFLLTLSNLATGVLGFIFSIYLSKILGPEGVGLYGLVMPIYNLFISIMTAGIIAAISKITAVYSSDNNYHNIVKTMRVVGVFNFVWGLLIGVLVFFLSPTIANFWIKDPRTVKAIMVTCPAMVFIALSNILKGFFYGDSKIVVPSFIDILEKSLRVFILAILIFMFKVKTLEGLVTLAYVSLCLGELQSLILLFGYFKVTIRKYPKNITKKENSLQLLFNVLVISFPLCLNGFLLNIFSTISTVMVPRRLISTGLSYSQSLALIGKFGGMALSIITFPMIIVNSINTLLIPNLSQSINKKDYRGATLRIKQVLRISLLIGLFTAVLCQCVPDSLGIMFFGRDDLGKMIKLSALIMPLSFVSSTMYGILNGLDKQNIILRNNIFISILEIICLFIFTGIPSINIYGYVLTMFISGIIALSINIYEVYKTIDLEISLPNLIIYILTSILSCIIVKNFILNIITLDYRIEVLLATILLSIVFSILIFGSKLKRISNNKYIKK
ncbi:MAG: stage V sporulation protein B [Clostridium perfringens]|nr:stage V sporulation protein B [Clostridium perfringens]